MDGQRKTAAPSTTTRMLATVFVLSSILIADQLYRLSVLSKPAADDASTNVMPMNEGGRRRRRRAYREHETNSNRSNDKLVANTTMQLLDHKGNDAMNRTQQLKRRRRNNNNATTMVRNNNNRIINSAEGDKFWMIDNSPPLPWSLPKVPAVRKSSVEFMEELNALKRRNNIALPWEVHDDATNTTTGSSSLTLPTPIFILNLPKTGESCFKLTGNLMTCLMHIS
jgi:hypothetical protein